jgi:hypothetical protein
LRRSIRGRLRHLPFRVQVRAVECKAGSTKQKQTYGRDNEDGCLTSLVLLFTNWDFQLFD